MKTSKSNKRNTVVVPYPKGKYNRLKGNPKQATRVNPSVENIARIFLMPKDDYKPYSAEQLAVLDTCDAFGTYIDIGWMTAKHQYPHMDGYYRSQLIRLGVHSQRLLEHFLHLRVVTEKGESALAFYHEEDLELTPYRVPIKISYDALYLGIKTFLYPKD